MNAIARFQHLRNPSATSEPVLLASRTFGARSKRLHQVGHVLLALLCGLLLMGCEPSRPIQPRLSIPRELFAVAPRPLIPADPDDRAVGRLLVEQSEWIDRSENAMRRLQGLLAEYVGD